MGSRDGRKTPTGSEIDDWFDLLDEESPAPPPKAPGPPTDISRKITPAVDPRVGADSWDWDMETPAVSAPSPPEARREGRAQPEAEPEPEAHPDDEFTDFGAPMPVAAASLSTPLKSEVTRRFQGTMMFGATPLPTTAQSVPAPVTQAPPAAPAPPPVPPPPLPPVAPQSRPPGQASLRQRTPVPRTPVPRAPAPRANPQMVPRAQASNRVVAQSRPAPPPSYSSAPIEADDLEFEDVVTPRPSAQPPPPPRAERRSEKSTQQRATPVVPVAEISRAQLTPVVERAIPPEAQRSPVPQRRPSAPEHAVTPPSTRREMVDRFDLGDFTGALALAETLLGIDRADAEARRIAETSRTKLRAIYVGRLGALDQVPVMMIPHAELRWLALDHRAGFVLSLVDGTSSIEEIIDVSTMPQLEVLRTLYNLLSQNVISLRRPRH